MDNTLFKELVSILAPGEISKNFELEKIEETNNSITLIFTEKSTLIPEALQGKETVLNGFLNPLELQTFPLKDKPVYLIIKRRRWKEKGKNEKSYSNPYALNEEGIKATKEFGAFLKESFGCEPDSYNKLWESPSS